MSLLLAPYNTAMRIGQGFNSYTHEICVNDAVLVNKTEPGGDHFAKDTNNVSQIVTYCTRYVDKLSQVTDAMNISGALTIKSASVGGSGSGSYVDSDKFKESDINFFVQVKVTNQIIMAEDVTQFNPIKGVDNFNKVFGDCFISGFIEGGELDAIISIKMRENANSTDIKGALEVNFGKGGVGVDIKGEVAIQHAKAFEDSETTITVNWMGGGNIKEKSTLWSIESLTKAAAEFSHNVQACPQRTYAILTKYTALRSFQETMSKFKPLNYDYAQLYTDDLLDAYMDYRNIWKKIHLDTTSYEFNQVTLEKADPYRPSEPRKSHPLDERALVERILATLARSKAKSQDELRDEALADLDDRPKLEEHSGQAYEPDLDGLQKARRDCRVEMIKIVAEIDQITDDPMLALDVDRNASFLNPAVFRKLLPTTKEVMDDSAGTITDKAAAPVKSEFYDSSKPLPAVVENWVKGLRPDQTAGFRMTPYAGDGSTHDAPNFGHMLEDVVKDGIVSKFEVQAEANHVKGLRLTYRGSGKSVVLGNVQGGSNLQEWLVPDGEKITNVELHSGQLDFKNTPVVIGFQLKTDKNTEKFLGVSDVGQADTTTAKFGAPKGMSLKGFWSQYGNALDRVGIFWGRDGQPQRTNGTKT